MARVYRPFALSAAIVLADQVSKLLIVMHIPQNTIGFEFFSGFLRIIHVANPAVAFSLGRGLPQPIRSVLFIIIPIILICILCVFMVKNKEVTQLQRWAFAAIVGGGAGNLIDRIFRTDGVIDFIDVKFYGIFGLERWPAFNVADSAIVVGSVFLVASVLFQGGKRGNEK